MARKWTQDWESGPSPSFALSTAANIRTKGVSWDKIADDISLIYHVHNYTQSAAMFDA